MYYLEDCYERNAELSLDCDYKYYVLHYVGLDAYCDDHVYDGDEYVIVKVYKL